MIDFSIIERGVSIAICATIAGEQFYSRKEYETEQEALDDLTAIRSRIYGQTDSDNGTITNCRDCEHSRKLLAGYLYCEKEKHACDDNGFCNHG